MIPFNKPFVTGNELLYMQEAIINGKLSGGGAFSQKCQTFFETKYGFKKCLLTTSCTDALEMSALLLNIKAGDEIIIPSYTFVSSANPFVLRNAKIVFADSQSSSPNIDVQQIEALITPNTKAIVVVHYAGIACEMDSLLQICEKHNLYLVEDAAQAIDATYKGKPLGSFGHLSAFSFHDTKNITCGEGGMLVINDESLIGRAEIIWEKGTNRKKFFRGEVDKYEWVDVGSSFLLSELNAAFLLAQLEQLDNIQLKRKAIWATYHAHLSSYPSFFQTPYLPDYATNNGHIYYILCKDRVERNELMEYLKQQNIQTTFHYQSLHKSVFFTAMHDNRILQEAEKFTDCLLRLPFYYELTVEEVKIIAQQVIDFFSEKSKN
jgi:dTDP-4-amino-4,6-dideoxygalactose transaminase